MSTTLGEPKRLSVPPGDDAAVWPDGRAITVDTMVQGVHFDERLSAQDVGYKLIAVSVSDLAAMGANPEWAVLSVSLPAVSQAWIEEFATGVARATRRWSIALIGGDTTGSPGPIMVSATLGGRCVANPLTRDAAQVGDTLWVTGIPGLAGAGWMAKNPSAASLQALRAPQPPVAFALTCARRGLVRAAMDISDGLAVDLPRLCRASGVGARVILGHLPRHPDIDPRVHSLCGGEDYQLLFAAAPRHSDALRSVADDHSVRLTAIGTVTEEPSVQLDDGTWPQDAYQHFPEAP